MVGLLDSIIGNGSGGGGLLDFLRNNAMNQQMLPAGLPSDQAQYGGAPMAQAPVFAQQNAQSSPLDNAQWPSGPIGAPSQANAQMAPQASAMMPPQASPMQAQQGAATQPPPAVQAAFMQPPVSSGFGAAARGALANMQNGPLGMIGGALAGGLGMGQGNPLDIQRQNQQAQYQAFIGAGMTPQNAMLAVLNPEAAKTLVSEALTNKEQFKTITDAIGNQVPVFVNERDQTINGKPVGQADVGGSAGFLAPGVKQIDSSLTGKDYLGQFSPEIQAAVKNYVDGKSTPTGNPRKGFTQTVKMIAQKYGADTGESVDDATFAARKTMRNQLSSSAPASLGGQINIGNTAAGHLADLSQKALDLGNYDTGLAPLTSMVNSVRGLGTEQAAKMEALKGAAQHYGQEITKFYAGSPGGTAERDRFIESVNGARSPKELAAILATEGELMRSRLDALGGQIKGVLGEEGAKQYPVLRADGQAALAKVEENVSKLKGNAPTPAAPASSGIPSGWSVKVR